MANKYDTVWAAAIAGILLAGIPAGLLTAKICRRAALRDRLMELGIQAEAVVLKKSMILPYGDPPVLLTYRYRIAPRGHDGVGRTIEAEWEAAPDCFLVFRRGDRIKIRYDPDQPDLSIPENPDLLT